MSVQGVDTDLAGARQPLQNQGKWLSDAVGFEWPLPAANLSLSRNWLTGSNWDKGVKEIVRDVDQETTSLGQTRVDGRSVAT
jgi:hypothetical protein